MEEIWKIVVVNGEVYDNYMVSNLGNVKSLKFGKERMLKPVENKGNYLIVRLFKDGKRKKCRIHRLVAESFIPKIEGKEFVDHIDGNRQNNNVNNLRWCSQVENNNFDLYRKHMSEAKKGEKNSMYGKTGALHNRSKAILCVELNEIFESEKEASIKLGICHSSISKCCRGEYKTSGGYHWRYL